MSIEARFMEIARTLLPPETYDHIYTRAVQNEREAIERRPVISPNTRKIIGDRTIELLNATINKELDKQLVADLTEATGEMTSDQLRAEIKIEVPPRPSHVVERLEERAGLAVTQADMHELLTVIQRGGPNCETVRQWMDLTQEVTVNWRGKHFTVIWSKSRNKLITVVPYRRKHRKKVHVGRPRDTRRLSFEDELNDALQD